jgi:tRNA pseudouridine38-40 synthase
MRFWLLLLGYFLLPVLVVNGQTGGYLYLETDPAIPFYLRTVDSVYSSGRNSYLILAPLDRIAGDIIVGFPGRDQAAIEFAVKDSAAEQGVFLRKDAQGGWRLVDMQTGADLPSRRLGVAIDLAGWHKRTDEFALRLSRVMNDTLLLYEPVLAPGIRLLKKKEKAKGWEYWYEDRSATGVDTIKVEIDKMPQAKPVSAYFRNMSRYFIEVAYRGTNYAGFQRQENAHTVQAELEGALALILRQPVELTGSSRTDAGVHAHQNFFHFDHERPVDPRIMYNLNAVLPADLAVRSLRAMGDEAHSRFDAISREYRYHLCRQKDPFLHDRAYYFPYTLDLGAMQEAAGLLMGYEDFTSFSKRNTQVKTFLCRLSASTWMETESGYTYYVKGNRFLRGMVRALTGTMLKVGRGKMGLEDFRAVIEARDCTLADFAVPAKGLFLERVNYPDGYFDLA